MLTARHRGVYSVWLREDISAVYRREAWERDLRVFQLRQQERNHREKMRLFHDSLCQLRAQGWNVDFFYNLYKNNYYSSIIIDLAELQASIKNLSSSQLINIEFQNFINLAQYIYLQYDQEEMNTFSFAIRNLTKTIYSPTPENQATLLKSVRKMEENIKSPKDRSILYAVTATILILGASAASVLGGPLGILTGVVLLGLALVIMKKTQYHKKISALNKKSYGFFSPTLNIAPCLFEEADPTQQEKWFPSFDEGTKNKIKERNAERTKAIQDTVQAPAVIADMISSYVNPLTRSS